MALVVLAPTPHSKGLINMCKGTQQIHHICHITLPRDATTSCVEEYFPLVVNKRSPLSIAQTSTVCDRFGPLSDAEPRISGQALRAPAGMKGLPLRAEADEPNRRRRCHHAVYLKGGRMSSSLATDRARPWRQERFFPASPSSAVQSIAGRVGDVSQRLRASPACT